MDFDKFSLFFTWRHKLVGGENGALDGVVLNGDQAKGVGTGARIHCPQVAVALTVGDVCVAEEEQIGVCLEGGVDGGIVVPLHAPQVAVRQENLLASYLYQLDGGFLGPAVTVARDGNQRQLRIGVAEHAGIAHQISQVEDSIRLVGLDGGNHLAGAMMGVGKNQ